MHIYYNANNLSPHLPKTSAMFTTSIMCSMEIHPERSMEKMSSFFNYDHHVKNLRHMDKLSYNLHVVTTNFSYDYDNFLQK